MGYAILSEKFGPPRLSLRAVCSIAGFAAISWRWTAAEPSNATASV